VEFGGGSWFLVVPGDFAPNPKSKLQLSFVYSSVFEFRLGAKSPGTTRNQEPKYFVGGHVSHRCQVNKLVEKFGSWFLVVPGDFAPNPKSKLQLSFFYSSVFEFRLGAKSPGTTKNQEPKYSFKKCKIFLPPHQTHAP
jgi:hypothetical protein